ncbi:histidine phosphatase family protein [Aquirhabdus parva]|uniref:Histidine phosphatase family protein n=1 Tax=Aquirhabdus parva TaxID=2283318 RepID=A0A345P7M7_9GAMM|nr:histidine phosphatase family protein [Aquirhabdus parva]AXI03286.1 histidine phosphatase family protein [Aquirhabdus parva]
MSTITLIRHGQASFGKSDYDQLSDIGYDQARRLGVALAEREESIDTVFIGGMLRHRQTAETCLESMGLDLPLQVLPDFSEFNHEHILEKSEPRYRDREWIIQQAMQQSVRPEEVFMQMFKASITRWVDGQHEQDYDETWPQFQQRVKSGLDTVAALLNQSQHALVFTSGGCISVIAQALLELNNSATFRTNWTLANCGLTRIAQSARHRNLMSLNEYGHFSGRHHSLLTFR